MNTSNLVELAYIGRPRSNEDAPSEKMYLITGKDSVITIKELNAILAKHGYTVMAGVAHNNYSIKQLPQWLRAANG